MTVFLEGSSFRTIKSDKAAFKEALSEFSKHHSMDSAAGIEALIKRGLLDTSSASSLDAATTQLAQGYGLHKKRLFTMMLSEAVENIIHADLPIDRIMSKRAANDILTEQVSWRAQETTANLSLFKMSGNVPVQAGISTQTYSTPVVRFTGGFSISEFEKKKMARDGIDVIGSEQVAVTRALAEKQNEVAFFGYGDVTTQQIFGLNNNPNNPTATPVTGATWSGKDADEVEKDITTALTDGADRIGNPNAQLGMSADYEVKMVVSAKVKSAFIEKRFSGTNERLSKRIQETYPFLTIVWAKELDDAFAGSDGFVLIIKKIPGKNLETYNHVLPCALFVHTPVMNREVEEFRWSTSTSGAILTSPIGVVRKFGI